MTKLSIIMTSFKVKKKYIFLLIFPPTKLYIRYQRVSMILIVFTLFTKYETSNLLTIIFTIVIVGIIAVSVVMVIRGRVVIGRLRVQQSWNLERWSSPTTSVTIRTRIPKPQSSINGKNVLYNFKNVFLTKTIRLWNKIIKKKFG